MAPPAGGGGGRARRSPAQGPPPSCARAHTQDGGVLRSSALRAKVWRLPIVHLDLGPDSQGGQPRGRAGGGCPDPGACSYPPERKRRTKTAAWWTFTEGKGREGQRMAICQWAPPAADENTITWLLANPPPPVLSLCPPVARPHGHRREGRRPGAPGTANGRGRVQASARVPCRPTLTGRVSGPSARREGLACHRTHPPNHHRAPPPQHSARGTLAEGTQRDLFEKRLQVVRHGGRRLLWWTARAP